MRGAVSIALAYNKVMFEANSHLLWTCLQIFTYLCLSMYRLLFILDFVNFCSLQHLVILQCELMLSWSPAQLLLFCSAQWWAYYILLLSWNVCFSYMLHTVQNKTWHWNYGYNNKPTISFYICFFMRYVNMLIGLKVHRHGSTTLLFSFEKNERTTTSLIYMPSFDSGFRSADQAAA